ncbi:MAG: hypothetical protein Q7R78_00165 [bacterium]|nr:hypothetical protein [bacterium]
MKNTKTKIILSAIIFLSVIGIVGTAIAAGASLYVSPASLTKVVGDTFNVSVGVNVSGNKVFAVEGTLVFNNLSCQSITVADGLMAQSAPTCSNPHFLIGIPNGTIADKVLLTTSVRSESVGAASINSTGVDIVGEGVSVGSASMSGNYTINAVPKPKTTPTLTPKPKSTAPQTSNGFIGYVNGDIQTFPTQEAAQRAGATGIEPNYQKYPAVATSTQSVVQEATNTPLTQQEVVQPVSNTQIAAVAESGSPSYAWLWMVLIIIVLALIGWWMYSRKTDSKY